MKVVPYASIIIAIVTSMAVLSCTNRDDPGPACGGLLEYNSADSVVVCFTESAVELAQSYNTTAYLLREYQIARDAGQSLTGSIYNLSFSQWREESWLVRRSFLPFPFSRNIFTADSSELLFNILTYPEQFGFGWEDTYNEDVDLSDPSLGHIWFTDNLDTPGFDGRSDLYTDFSAAVVYLR